MNIVIVGAGNIGKYIARILSKDQHNIILIDKNPKRLEEASWQLDIATKEGDASDWKLLDSIMDLTPDLFLALTDNENDNLVSCAIAKNLGYPRTIARIKSGYFLNRTRIDYGRIFDVDSFISPELLVAQEIYKYMISPGSIRVESLAHGAVQLRTLIIPKDWQKSTIPISQLNLPAGIIVSLIRREKQTSTPLQEKDEIIFPHGNDPIYPDDEVTLIGESDPIADIHKFFGLHFEKVQSAVLLGGSQTALNLARILEKRNIQAKIIEKDLEKCKKLSEELKKTSIVHHEGTDLDFLIEEKVQLADVFACCTRFDEVNILTALIAKQAGCKNILVQLSNLANAPIVHNMGINLTASPQIVAANKILSMAFFETISSVISLYENQAEILEITVSLRSKIVGIPISELGPLLPKDFLIVMIQNRGRIMIANGNRIISPGDTVIVVTNPRHINELKNIF
jgi:trk system potassium uptake protein TrkA